MRETKIIATYGPSVASVDMVRKLCEAGVNVFRINCSHGAADDFFKAVETIREGISQARYPVAILFDISGPKLRLSRFSGELPINKGDTITLTTGKTDISKNTISVNHPAIIASVKKGERVFIDDGNYMFDVVSTSAEEVKLIAQNHGTLLPGKGINLPDSDIKINTITEKDRQDIKSAVKAKADYIALSFVRSGDDIIEARKLIKQDGGDQRIIAKLEKQEAIDKLEEIMLLADGVMVARGDLGVECPPEELPRLQKKITSLANRHHKPVIVATQMLESMRFSPRATRAEINDVASAVMDFVDAVMLSAETASGEYPIESVKTMAKVIKATEKALPMPEIKLESHLIRSRMPFAIADAVNHTKEHETGNIIFAFTTSGYTAELISNLRSSRPVMALTHDRRVMNRLALYRSVYSVEIPHPSSFEDMVATVQNVNRQFQLAKPDDTIIITGGAPFGQNVPTNFMMFVQVEKT